MDQYLRYSKTLISTGQRKSRKYSHLLYEWIRKRIWKEIIWSVHLEGNPEKKEIVKEDKIWDKTLKQSWEDMQEAK